LIQSRESTDSEDSDADAPAAATYKTHSSGIVDVLDDMKDKAEEELSSLRKAEGTAKHNFQMLKQSLEDQMADDSKQLDEEKAAKSQSDGEKAVAEVDLEKNTKSLQMLRPRLRQPMQTAWKQQLIMTPQLRLELRSSL